MRAAALAITIGAACASMPSCAASVPPAPARPSAIEPSWEDVFDETPELLVVVFPKALRADPVYGRLLGRAVQVAREQSRVVAETRALDAMEDASEVIIGARPDRPGAAGEVVVVVSGARADIDPERLVDDRGRPLWTPAPERPSEGIRELVERSPSPSTTPAPDDVVGASLFELPGHTWVITQGAATARVRAVFAHLRSTSRRRLTMKLGEGDLATVRIDGPSLVLHAHALKAPGALGTMARALQWITLELPREPELSKREVVATLSYPDARTATLSEASGREVLGAIAREKPKGLAWLAPAKLERDARRVVVTAPLPAALVDVLLTVGAASKAAKP